MKRNIPILIKRCAKKLGNSSHIILPRVLVGEEVYVLFASDMTFEIIREFKNGSKSFAEVKTNLGNRFYIEVEAEVRTKK